MPYPDIEECLVLSNSIESHPFVREGVVGTTRRAGRIAMPGCTVLGWAECPKKGSGIQPYARRVWYLKPHDDPKHRDHIEGNVPTEAVYPTSISQNQRSKPVLPYSGP